MFFIVALLTELAFLVRGLLDYSKYIKHRRSMACSDAPPDGSIIRGARNWDGQPDPAIDIEAVAAVPPAYGMYQGSVRINDSDIRYLFRN
jgi:hypothetical protein